MTACPLCQSLQTSLVYSVYDAPLFQNKVYTTEKLAKAVPTAAIQLRLCHACGFVFNAIFDASLMSYDNHYENEQAHSDYFQHYLANIISLFKSKSFLSKKIIEIGCGKGFFLEKLIAAGFNVHGFDPAYEGRHAYIIKDYFSDRYPHLAADIIILRHVLEHIQNPLEFLHQIASAVNYRGLIYIEVPSLAWILNHVAFWDIFYEHCNYFTAQSLSFLFDKFELGFLFNDQYLYLIADLSHLKKHITPTGSNSLSCKHFLKLVNFLNFYQKKLATQPGTALWGAGAKGVTFANLIDPQKKYLSYLIDINPKKQNGYIAKTAHKIIAPSSIETTKITDILVMNNNYYAEIKKSISTLPISIKKLKIRYNVPLITT